MQHHDMNNFQRLLAELNSITHNTNEFNNLDSKYILRQRILIINKFEGFDNSTKNKIIQQLMMLGDRSNTNHDLNLKDIHVSLSESSIVEESNDNKSDQSDIKYGIENDYNLINNHKCTHFKSNLKLYNKEQDMWYSCKNCYLDTKGKNKRHNQENHCKCINCDELFSEYQCHYCLIFENDEENYMYHCPYCKECKLGEGLGIDYNHCKECDCCMPLEMFHNEEVSHRCIRNNLSSDCTICGVRLDAYQTYERLLDDDMESTNTVVNENNDEGQVQKSSKSFQNNGVRKRPIIDIDVGRVQFLVPCNHAIHETCLNEYLKNGQYKCPICQVTIVDMEINFKLLDEEIQQCPLPEPYNMWRCVYKCNDCTTRGMTHSCPERRSNSEMKDNDMDNFLNKFLSKDEDLSVSHVLQGLKEYYTVKKNDKKITDEANELGLAETVDVNSMMNRLKFNVLNRFLSKKPNSDTESDTNELTEEKDGIDEDNSRQKTLFNDIGDSFKQFISFLEDSNAHNID
ncbi:unnamed protein product [Hanseniaspora opuntiae]